jgi:hypothetical protein
MTDLQMVLIIGIPTMSVLVAMWRSDKRIDDLAKRLDDKIDGGFARIDQRFNLVDRRFDLVDQRFDQVYQRFDQVDAENRFFHGTIGEHNEAIAILKRGGGAMTSSGAAMKANWSCSSFHPRDVL